MDNAGIVAACLVIMSLSLLMIAVAAVMTAVEIRRALCRVHRMAGTCEAAVDQVAGLVAGVVNRVTSFGQGARRWWSGRVEHVGNGTRRERRRG